MADSPVQRMRKFLNRTGFAIIILIMLTTTVFLSICCTRRAAGTGLADGSSLLPDQEGGSTSGFIVIEMSDTMEGALSDLSSEGEIIGIGPLPQNSSFAFEDLTLEEIAAEEEETPQEDMVHTGGPDLSEEDVRLEEVTFQDNADLAEKEASSEEVVLEEVSTFWSEHVVASGENLVVISQQYGLTPDDIARANDLSNPDMLRKGQLLLIPASSEFISRTREELERRKAEELEKRNQVDPVRITAYVVSNGDSLWSIANKFNLSIDTLFACNTLKDPDYLKPGTTLKVPNQDGLFHKISKGDTLSTISSKYKSDPDLIRKANPQVNLDTLQIGDNVFIPGASPASSVYSLSDGRSVSYSRDFRWPVVGKVNSPFGWRRHPITRKRSFHTGVDIKARTGTIIRAAQGGRVAYSGWMGGYGRVVVVNHGNGYSTLYAHCSRLLVRKGTKVSSGQAIGKVGSSGRVTGPHLHFEVRKNNKPINPLQVLR